METRRVFVLWDGPEHDILSLLPEPWQENFGADPDEDDIRLVLYRRLDEHEEATGEVIGVEILDFLTFERWHALSGMPHQWQIQNDEPLPLPILLRRLQVELRKRANVAAHA